MPWPARVPPFLNRYLFYSNGVHDPHCETKRGKKTKLYSLYWLYFKEEITSIEQCTVLEKGGSFSHSTETIEVCGLRPWLSRHTPSTRIVVEKNVFRGVWTEKQEREGENGTIGHNCFIRHSGFSFVCYKNKRGVLTNGVSRRKSPSISSFMVKRGPNMVFGATRKKVDVTFSLSVG